MDQASIPELKLDYLVELHTPHYGEMLIGFSGNSRNMVVGRPLKKEDDMFYLIVGANQLEGKVNVVSENNRRLDLPLDVVVQGAEYSIGNLVEKLNGDNIDIKEDAGQLVGQAERLSSSSNVYHNLKLILVATAVGLPVAFASKFVDGDMGMVLGYSGVALPFLASVYIGIKGLLSYLNMRNQKKKLLEIVSEHQAFHEEARVALLESFRNAGILASDYGT